MEFLWKGPWLVDMAFPWDNSACDSKVTGQSGQYSYMPPMSTSKLSMGHELLSTGFKFTFNES